LFFVNLPKKKVIFPDEEYEILYEDDRDVDVDNLTGKEGEAEG
jgi:hypothetical protein